MDLIGELLHPAIALGGLMQALKQLESLSESAWRSWSARSSASLTRAWEDVSSRHGKPILILGGTGKAGRRVAAQLRQRGLTARAASRSGPQRFDWDDEGTWAPALDGVDSVYVVTLDTHESACAPSAT